MMDKTFIKTDDQTEAASSSITGQDILIYSEITLNDNGTENKLIVETFDKDMMVKQSEKIIKTYMDKLSRLAVDAPETEKTGSL